MSFGTGLRNALSPMQGQQMYPGGSPNGPPHVQGGMNGQPVQAGGGMNGQPVQAGGWGQGGGFSGGGPQGPVYAARRAAAGVGGHIFDHGQLMSLAQIQAQHMPTTQPPGMGGQFGANPPMAGGGQMYPGGSPGGPPMAHPGMGMGGGGGMGSWGGLGPITPGQFGGGMQPGGGGGPVGQFGGGMNGQPVMTQGQQQPGSQFASNPHLQQLMQRLQGGGAPAMSPGGQPVQ